MTAEQLDLDGYTDHQAMNRIVIIRHGNYGDDGKLNDTGRRQMRRLGDCLKETLDEGEKVLILSSVALRAVESAEIIASIISAPIEQHEVLWSENRHPENFPLAYQLVESVRAKTTFAVLVTHMEYACEFPAFLGKEDLGLEIPYLDIEKGEGVVIDYRSGTFSHLRA